MSRYVLSWWSLGMFEERLQCCGKTCDTTSLWLWPCVVLTMHSAPLSGHWPDWPPAVARPCRKKPAFAQVILLNLCVLLTQALWRHVVCCDDNAMWVTRQYCFQSLPSLKWPVTKQKDVSPTPENLNSDYTIQASSSLAHLKVTFVSARNALKIAIWQSATFVCDQVEASWTQWQRSRQTKRRLTGYCWAGDDVKYIRIMASWCRGLPSRRHVRSHSHPPHLWNVWLSQRRTLSCFECFSYFCFNNFDTYYNALYILRKSIFFAPLWKSWLIFHGFFSFALSPKYNL